MSLQNSHHKQWHKGLTAQKHKLMCIRDIIDSFSLIDIFSHGCMYLGWVLWESSVCYVQMPSRLCRFDFWWTASSFLGWLQNSQETCCRELCIPWLNLGQHCACYRNPFLQFHISRALFYQLDKIHSFWNLLTIYCDGWSCHFLLGSTDKEANLISHRGGIGNSRLLLPATGTLCSAEFEQKPRKVQTAQQSWAAPGSVNKLLLLVC